MSTPKSINTNFRNKDDELYDWIISQLGNLDNPGNRSRLGREAFAVLRLFGSLDFAQTTVAMLLVAANEAYQSEVVDTEMESSLIGSDGEYADKADWIDGRLNEWRDEAIAAGVKLARGEE